MHRFLTSLLLAVAAEMAAGILLIVAVGFAGGALYLFLLDRMSAPVAALVTGGVALAAAILVLVAGRFISARACRTGKRNRTGQGLDGNRQAEELAELLGKNVASFVCAHARGTTLVSLLAGIAVGAHPRLRQSLLELIRVLLR